MEKNQMIAEKIVTTLISEDTWILDGLLILDLAKDLLFKAYHADRPFLITNQHGNEILIK